MLVSHEVINLYPEMKETKIFVVEETEAVRAAWGFIINTKIETLREMFKLPFSEIFLEIRGATFSASCNHLVYMPDGYQHIVHPCVGGTWYGRDIERGLFRQGVRFLITQDLTIHLLLEKEQKDIDADTKARLQGHAWAIICQICLINSPKIIDTITKPTQHYLNKKRIRNGKPPITEYHVIKLKPEIECQFKESEKNAASGKMPFHWRRGHFKALPCGLRWWNAHTVGKKENGEIVSGYLMEESA